MYFFIAINRQCRGAVFVNAVLLLLYYEMRLAGFYSISAVLPLPSITVRDNFRGCRRDRLNPFGGRMNQIIRDILAYVWFNY